MDVQQIPNRRLFLLQQMPQQSVGAEIGVWRGKFSNQILEIVKPKILHLIDPWIFQPNYPDRWYGGKKAKNHQAMEEIYEGVVNKFAGRNDVIIHRGLSENIVDLFEDGYFDWIYIDGNHSYEFVKKDLECFYPKVKAEGWITGDDYNWGQAEGYPVKKAVDELIANGGVEKIAIENSQFILQKI